MDPELLVNKLKKELQRGINSLKKAGYITNEWFERYSISSPKSRLHSRILGIIARMNLEEGWVIDIERALNAEKGARQFKPDAICWATNDKMACVIEFESINSSDTRIEWKDIQNYINYVSYPSKEENLPIVWVIITTLKSGPVEVGDWYSWDWAQEGEFYDSDDSDKQWSLLLKSPLNFWKNRFLRSFEIAFKKTKGKCPICWINIDSGKVIIEKIITR